NEFFGCLMNIWMCGKDVMRVFGWLFKGGLFRWIIGLGKMEVWEGEDFGMNCWNIGKGNEFMVFV
uniref:hypothetical protein n=1 Tax=Bacillus sp. WP8 TaxID=756828 RepID=UPI001C92DE4E